VLYQDVTSSELVALQGKGPRFRSELSPDGLVGQLGLAWCFKAMHLVPPDARGIETRSDAQTGLAGCSSAQVDSAA